MIARKMTTADDHPRSPETLPEMEADAVKDIARKILEEAETESNGSSEAETESPRSVGRWGFSKEKVHSQVLRIREEELCVIVEDKATNYCSDPEDRRYIHPRRLNLFLVSRPILPCSPLSGKVSSLEAVQ
ncbi:PREDICTED: uncharacterized protein LOC104821033 [Tarenaya hassleriana]|uniref:uncharacterized protein LOC104821033 n=1 Tax=Tarenaya hassleriana TaxID=28532 RepID=UPI00053C5B2E|nr:PREDICTED: uncharacterized protein LOC104821033 [Tarenaya hassleriana]